MIKIPRLDNAISEMAYILDCLIVYREIIKTGDCNECMKKNECKYAPKAGRMVRYNCPFFERENE